MVDAKNRSGRFGRKNYMLLCRERNPVRNIVTELSKGIAHPFYYTFVPGVRIWLSVLSILTGKFSVL